jgi:membrane protein required for colicin V production
MSWLDAVLGGILIGSTVAGIAKGFLRLGIGLAATFLAFLMASWFYADAGAWATPYTSSKGVANFVGYLLVFFGVMIAGALLSRLLAHIFKWIGLSWLDRAGGGLLGLVRGGLICLVIVLMISSFLPGDPPAVIVHSRISPYILEGSNLLAITASPEMRQQFRQTYEKVKKAWVDPVRDRFEKLEQ